MIRFGTSVGLGDDFQMWDQLAYGKVEHPNLAEQHSLTP